MFLKSKYIFETQKTRTIRYLKNFTLTFFLSLFLYVISALFFIQIASSENQKSEKAFFKKPPDLIVVFTGDTGRIPYAIEKAIEYNQIIVYIELNTYYHLFQLNVSILS